MPHPQCPLSLPRQSGTHHCMPGTTPQPRPGIMESHRPVSVHIDRICDPALKTHRYSAPPTIGQDGSRNVGHHRTQGDEMIEHFFCKIIPPSSIDLDSQGMQEHSGSGAWSLRGMISPKCLILSPSWVLL